MASKKKKPIITKKQIIKYLKKNYKQLILFLLSLFLLLFFRNVFFAVVLIALTIIVSFVSNSTKLKLFGVELVTFSTIVLGYAYGPMWGLLSGLGLATINNFMVRRGVRSYNFWVIPAFGVSGFAAGILNFVPIAVLGISITIGLHMIHTGLSLLFHSRLHQKYLMYVIPNIVLNAILFFRFATGVLGLL